MCGLTGIAGNLEYKDLDVFKDLLLWNQSRGEDATGVGTYRRTSGSVEVVKAAIPSSQFLDFRRAQAAISSSCDAIIGHTRKSTHAHTTRSNESAHPFHHKHIIGVHNGHLDWEARTKFNTRNHQLIDSEELMINIAEHGVDAVIPNIWGAWALVWVNAKEKSLNFLRNDQRPLSLAFSEDHKRIFWSSEFYMLKAALVRHGVKTTTEDPVTLKANNWLSFNLDCKEPVKEYEESELAGGEVPEKKWTYQGGYGGSSETRARTYSPPGNGRRTNLCEVGGRSGTPGANSMSPSTEALKKARAKLETAKLHLLNYNYTRFDHWSGNVRKRWKNLMKNIAQYECDIELLQKKVVGEALAKRQASASTEDSTPQTVQEEWDTMYGDAIPFESPESDEEDCSSIIILPNVGMTLSAFKAQLNEHGCGVCNCTSIDEVDPHKCELTPSSDIICDGCASDPDIRVLSGLKPLTHKAEVC